LILKLIKNKEFQREERFLLILVVEAAGDVRKNKYV
jgi:hypothetical protein